MQLSALIVCASLRCSRRPCRSASLAERLQEQLALRELPVEHARWVGFLISCLDPSGLLSLSDEECLHLAAEEGLEDGEVQLGPAIATLQSFEPRGVGGRDAVEAMLLQLDPTEPMYPLLCQLLEDLLGDAGSWFSVATAMAVVNWPLQRLARVIPQKRFPKKRFSNGS